MEQIDKPIHAIYRQREDRDFEFVCAHNCEELDEIARRATGQSSLKPTAEFVRDLCAFLNAHGDTFKVVTFDEPNQMPSILTEEYMAVA